MGRAEQQEERPAQQEERPAQQQEPGQHKGPGQQRGPARQEAGERARAVPYPGAAVPPQAALPARSGLEPTGVPVDTSAGPAADDVMSPAPRSRGAAYWEEHAPRTARLRSFRNRESAAGLSAPGSCGDWSGGLRAPSKGVIAMQDYSGYGQPPYGPTTPMPPMPPRPRRRAG
jgi:hypothetical protein